MKLEEVFIFLKYVARQKDNLCENYGNFFIFA